MSLEGKARSLFWLLFFGGPRGRVAWAHRGLEFSETGLPATRTRSLRGQSRPRRCRHCPAATQSSRAPSTTPLSAPQAPCASLTRFLAQGPRLLPQTLLLCSSSLVPSGCHMPEHTVGVPHVCPRTLSAPRWVRVAVELSSLNLDVAAPWPQPGGLFCDPDADAEVRRGLHLPNVSRPVTTG